MESCTNKFESLNERLLCCERFVIDTKTLKEQIIATERDGKDRVELSSDPCDVDRFFIDGPMEESDLRYIVPDPGPSLAAPSPGGPVYFESPKNPHSGCFVLSSGQLHAWVSSRHWLDGDASFVSPLESAATLGIAKTFRLYKPIMAMGSWLELQHWGSSFHSLLGNVVSLPDHSEVQESSDDKAFSQSQK